MYNAFKLKSKRLDVINLRFPRSSSTAGQQEVLKTKRYEDIPGPKSYPIIGTLYTYLPWIGVYNAETLDKNAWLNWRRYGDLFKEFPGVRVVSVFDPEDIEAVFRHDGRYPARRSHLAMLHYRLGKPQFYNTGGLLATNGPDWGRIRSAFQKNFSSPQSVKGHIESMDEIARDFIQWIKSSNVTHHDDFMTYLNRLNLEVIGKVAFDERFSSFSKEEQDDGSRTSKTIAAAFGSNTGIMKLDKGVLWRFFKTPLYNELAESQEYLEKVASEILLRKMHFFKHESDGLNKSLLGSFLQQPNIDMKDINGMMVDILMAAIDTTSNSTSFVLYHLAKNTKCQEKLYEEVSSILPHKDSVLTADGLGKAHYTRLCVKESLRLNPISIGVSRILDKDIILKGFHIPKDTVIITQNMVASRLPQNVRDPLCFEPDRWSRSSQESQSLHPFLSLPFGFGARSCIARRLAEQNICITLIRMVREFSFNWMGKELGIQTMLINKPDQPISLDFKTRIQ